MIPPAHKPAINYRMQLRRTRCLLFIILIAHTIENIRRNFIISCVYTRPLYRCVQCNFLSRNIELRNTFCAWAGGGAANYPTGLCFVYEFASEEISLSRCRILFFSRDTANSKGYDTTRQKSISVKILAILLVKRNRDAKIGFI